jgi:putative ABC transport system permease protein
MLWTEVPTQNLHEGRSAWWNFDQWRRQSQTFAELTAFDPMSVTLAGAEGAEHISAVRVSPSFFHLLGVQPLRGRTFTDQEAEQRQHLVLISSRFWQTRFAGSEDAIGAQLEMDGLSFRIIGVLPPDFEFARLSAEIWEPHTVAPDWDPASRGMGPWFVLGRLWPSVDVAQAQAEMNVIARRLDDQLPETDRKRGIKVVPLKAQLTGARPRAAMWMLMGALFCVLLIAGANVAGLSFARSAMRGQELAVRGAVGASRWRIIRQLLVESLTLALMSGALGLLVAVAGIRTFRASQPWNLDRLSRVGLDPLVLGCALALCLLTGILVGLVPAITISRRSLTPSGGGGRGISSGTGMRAFRRVLVVTQFALAAVLLTGAGLLMRSLWAVENVDPGFRLERILSLQLSSPAFKSLGQRADFYNRVLQQIGTLPGVEQAGIIDDLFVGGTVEQTLVVEGDARTSSERVRLRSDAISDGLLQTLGIPLVRGRSFNARDRADSPRVAIINETLARQVWPGSGPLGKRFRIGTGLPESWITVVGVVGDLRRQGPENESIPQMFAPLEQDPSRLVTLLVRTTAADPLQIGGAVRLAVNRVDKRAPLYGMTSLENRIGSFLTLRRFESSLLAGFAVVALLMAAIGIYGLIQYSVSTRIQEIGIRVAVGAQAGEILRMILQEGLQLSLLGLALGLAGALAAGRAASSLLFGVVAADPWTFSSVSLLLTAVATAACYFPARRAMKIDPIAALRNEN